MESTRETDHLVKGTFVGMLASVVALPLVHYVMAALGGDDVWDITGGTLLLLVLVLLLPSIIKFLRGERYLSIEEDMRSLKATITGRAVGVLLGLILGAPAILIWR